MSGKRFIRSIKNISYTATEAKVRQFTSNDPWGPSGTDLDQVSKYTFDDEKLKDVITILKKRLLAAKNSSLHILKSLTVIQYCLQVGSQEFVNYFKVNSDLIERLISYDIANKSSGNSVNIRRRSKYIMKLINDEMMLQRKRENFHKLRSEMLIPGIKSSDKDKTVHLRYSLDGKDHDIVEKEVVLLSGEAGRLVAMGGARSTSLDIKRLNYYKKNQNGKLAFITEENHADKHDDLQQKIDALTSAGNPFRSGVALETLENRSLTHSLSNSSSSSFSVASADSNISKKFTNNPFLQARDTNISKAIN